MPMQAHSAVTPLSVTLAPGVHSIIHTQEHTLTPPAHSHTQLPALGAGGGAGALQADTRLLLPAPWGSLQMPGVILSLDQWTIFW